MGTVLRWVTALLCCPGCCEEVCGGCQSSQSAGCLVPRSHCRAAAGSCADFPALGTHYQVGAQAVHWWRLHCSLQGAICKLQEKHHVGVVSAAAVIHEG